MSSACRLFHFKPDIIVLTPRTIGGNDETTDGDEMNTKWCLLKESDGTRGANGKKKVYEIVVDGNAVRTSWGMAEKPARQSSTQWFPTESHARQFALTRQYDKMAKGYKLAYAV